MMLWQAGLAIFGIYLLRRLLNFVSRWRKFVQRVDQVPGAPKDFLLGNSRKMLTAHHHDLFFFVTDNLIRPFYPNKLIRLWIGPEALIFIMDPTLSEVVLSGSRHITKAKIYSVLTNWLGTGLLTSTGKKWHTRRKMLTPTFHFKILEDFIDIFNEQSAIMLERLKEEAETGNVLISHFITLCALDIICESAMGRKVYAQKREDSAYVKAIHEMGEILATRAINPFLMPNFIFNLTSWRRREKKCLDILHSFTKKVIKERRQILNESKSNNLDNEDDSITGKKRRLAFLDTLIESTDNGRALTDEEIREEVDTFMFEGHDTTSAAVMWSIHLIGHHPDVQAKIHDELDSIFGDSTRPVTSNDLREMKYLESVIKESLRLFPSVPFYGRQLEEDVTLDDKVLPAGCTVVVIPYLLHRQPHLFPNPEQFDPDRFLLENNRHPFAYLPFSAGPRNCIGQKFAVMEEKVMLSSILRQFRVFSLDPTKSLKVTTEPVLRPPAGIRVSLERRKPVSGSGRMEG